MPRRSLGDLATPSFTQSYATGVELGRSLADSKSMREVRDAQLKDLMARSLRDTLRDKRVHDPAMLARTARVLDPAQEFTPEDATALMGVDFKHYSDTINARNTNVTMENAQADQKLQKEMQDAILKDKLAERERQDEQDRWARQDRAFKLFKEYYPTKTEAEIKRYTDSNSLMELMSRNKHLQTEQELSSVQATIERSEAWLRVNELSDLLNGEDPIQKIAGKGGGKPKPGEGPQATYLTKGTEKESALERMADLVSGAMPAKEFEYNKDSNTYEPKNEKDRESLRRIQTGIAFLSSLDVDGTPLPTGVMRELSLLEIMPLIIENELPLNAKPGKKQGGFLQSLKDRISGGGGGGEGTGTGGDGTGVNASTADSPPPEPELKNTLLGFPWQQVEDLADKVIAEIGDSEDPSAVPDEMARRMIEAKGRDLSGADIRQINKTLKSRAEATSGSTPAPEQDSPSRFPKPMEPSQGFQSVTKKVRDSAADFVGDLQRKTAKNAEITRSSEKAAENRRIEAGRKKEAERTKSVVKPEKPKASKPAFRTPTQQYFENREGPVDNLLHEAWKSLKKADKDRMELLQTAPSRMAERKRLQMQQAAEDSMKAAVEKIAQRAIKEEEVKAIRALVKNRRPQ